MKQDDLRQTTKAEGFSVIVTAYNEPEELRVCLESLEKNSCLPNEVLVLINPLPEGQHDSRVVEVARQFPEVRLILNETDVGCYGSWNKGAELATKEILCFMNADQYMAPRWDSRLLTFHTKKNILASQVVEPGVLKSYHTTLIQNFGTKGKEFDEKGFLEYIRQHEENRLAMDGFYIPTVIDKRLFFRLGAWPNKRPFPYPNDRIFKKRVLWKRGMEYQRVMNSFSYHFQNASFKKNLNGKPYYFEQKETPEKGALVEGPLGHFKTKLVRNLIRFGLRKRRVYGWCKPKRIDLQLVHRYCMGRGLEIGPGPNRFPHLNAISVDLHAGPRDEIYPPPDILGTAYNLSFFADGSRDFVFSSHLLERLCNPLRALREWHRVLKPGGILFSIVSDKRYVQKRVDHAPEATLKELLERERQARVETNDPNPVNLSHWTPSSFIAMLEHVGFQSVEAWEAPQKNIGLDTQLFNWDDFTVVVRKVK